MSRIVIAFGGNALGNNPKEQQMLIKKSLQNIVPLLHKKHELIISHGNGPQVGIINLAFEDSYENENIPYMPLPECTAMSQGYIGYHLEKGLREILRKENIKRKVATIITEVTVDRNDPSFSNPTKPIGPFYNKRMAEKLMSISGEKYIEDAGRGYRKVVASPEPLEIVQINTIKDLLKTGHIVIAGGGGGVPICSGMEKGMNAVIDKDLLSALMAIKLKADALIILTNIKQVQINYNTPDAKNIGLTTVKEMKKYISENQFAKGSMLPKVEAAINFVEKTGKTAIITDLNNLQKALNGIDATIIKKRL